jgi:gliding motility-associated-like protein
MALLVTINPTPATPSAISGSTTTSTQSSEVYSVTNDANATGYAWVLPNGWTGTSSINSITVTVGLSGGQIKVKAIIGSCASPFSTKTVDILNITNPPLTTDITFITGTIPSNIATNTTALITGTASTTLNFYTSTEAGAASSSTQTTPTEPGVYTYYVSQTSSIGVESILVPYTITIKPVAPPINTNNGIVGNTITYCKGASAFALTATISSGGTLKWYTVATGGASSNSAPTPSTSLVGTTNYYVSQVVNGVESDRVLIVVTVNDAPSSVTATATQPTCTNSSGYIVITSPLGTGFTYSVDGSNYTNTTLFSALPAGIYFATAKNNLGCLSAPTPITINTAVAPPLSPLVTVTQPTCATVTGSITILSSTLSTDNFSIDGGLNYQASKIFTGVAPGTYTVTTLNAGGCVSAGTAAIVNAALPIPAQPIISSSSASANICAGNTVTLTSSALTGNQWYKDGVLIAGAINQTYTPNASGDYTVIATNASGCASIPSDAQTITFNPLPIPVISNGATLAFDNCATTVITLTASNTNTSTGNTYQWYLNGNSINMGGNNSTYNANQAGNYSVVITNNGCSVTSAISKLIAAPSVNAANTAFCEGGSSLISGISTGFTSPSYQWRVSTNDGLSFGNATGAGTTSLTYTATTAGKYQLQVTDGGIVSTSCPINVTVFTNPTATITTSPSASVCVGSTISLNANVASGTASYTYQWLLAGGNDIAGAALSSYSTGVAGSYAVKVTDANGCVVNATPAAIVFNAVPTAPVVTITNPTCAVNTGTISVTSLLGAGYTYSIDGTNYTNTTGLFTGVTPGLTYNVTVKSSTGCTSNATVATIAAALVVPDQPVITGPANIIPFSLNTYSVAPVTGATSYSWNIPGYWSGVSTTNTITIKVDASAGSFSVTANSASCVSIAASKNITATILNPDVNVTGINVAVSGKLTTNDIIPAGTTYSQPGTNAANPTGASITVNANGSYTFTATTPGKYIYYVPVCAAGQTTGCPVSPLEITVLDPLAVTDKPVANNDIAIAKPGVPSTVNVLANDAAGNSGGTLNIASVSIASAPKHGVVVVNSDGTITYTPAAGYIGTDSVIYYVCDESSPTPLCQTAVIYFTVVPASAPSITTALDDYATVLASTGGTNAVSGNVLTNDKNSGGASLTASLVAGPTTAQGSFTMNANGSYTFTPTAGFSGPVDITYTVCTGETPANCATATIHILVEPAQVLNPDAVTAYINILSTGDISTNDVIQPGSTFAQPTQQSGATITVNTNGTYSFTATEPGTYTYVISVCAPGQTTNCPTENLVITVPVNTLVDNAATAYINVPTSGNISTNDAVPAGTTFGQPAQQTGATITINTDGTYSFTATAPGTYTYSVPVCAPGQTTGCPTENLVITVPVNRLVDNAAIAYISIPTSGNISTNDAVPAGTTYGQPAQQTGAIITINTDGTYSFTATAPGTYTYAVPVCAPGQTTNCPTETLEITVPVKTIVNDTAIAYVNITKTGNISTNDAVPTGTTYGQPTQQTGATITVNANGTYSFTATTAGTYTYTVSVCAPGQTTNCPTETLEITVIGNQPQGTINLKYNTLLASDSVHVKLKVYDGVGPYTMIFKNSINSRMDTVKNLTDSSIILLPPSSNDAVFTLLKIIDNKNSTRIANFDKDTARLTILKPKILLTLKAELPTKLPDNSFKTNILMKIKNNGGLNLQNVQVDADLSKVFPPDMQFVLDSVKVTSGNLALNKMYTGFGFAKSTNYISKVVNGFTIKYRSFSTLSGSDLFDKGVNLDINEEGSVVFYLTLKPGKNIDPLVLQFTSVGDGLLVQNDGNKSMQPTTSVSHDNSNVNAHPLLTTIGKPLPTYIPFFLINEIGASLEASEPVTVNGGYVFSFKSIIKNYSNSNLDSVAASFDINQFIKSPDAANIYGTPTVIGTSSFNTSFDGKNNIQLFKGVSQLKVGDSIKIAFDLFVKTDKTKVVWPTYLITKGITTTGDLKVTDTSTNGSNPDPNGNKIPNESIRTNIGIGIDPPPAPEVIAAVYEVDDKRNPKDISQLVKKIPIGTVPTWCNVDGTNCSINPPVLPNIVGTYIWCVKSLDTITRLSSTPCVYDTVRIIPINKYSKYDIIKSANTIEYDLSGKFIVGFNIKVVNKTDRQIDSILIQDDLTSTFKRADGFKLLSIASSGTLLANNVFDGISNIEMLKPSSYLAANSSDSIVIKIIIESESIEGDYNNTTNMKIVSDYGRQDLISNDTVVNKNGLTNRVATKFKVPKIELIIPGGFSPNNDGIDDTWKIQRPFGTKISVQVFNRWGNEVYANDNYLNDWRGKGVSNFMGEDVVEGTYFYIVLATDIDGAIKKFAGSLTIVR